MTGLSWYRVGTFTKSLAVDHFYLEIAQNGATTPVRAGWDWVRRDWLTL